MVGATAAALVIFAPVGLIADRLTSEVKARTGRDLRMAGRPSIAFYPAFGVSMTGVSLSAPRSMGGGAFVQMRKLEAHVSLLPLLTRRIEIDHLVLSDPVFDLRVDASGRRSWDFAGFAPSPAVMVAQGPTSGTGRQPPTRTDGGAVPSELEDFLRNSTPPEPPGSASQAPASRSDGRNRDGVQELALGDVRIENGTIRYRDERSGLSEEIRAIDARLTGKSLASPLEAKGSLALRGDRIEFDGRLSTPRALLEERPVKIALAVTGPRARGSYSGSLGLAKGSQLDGALKLDVPSVRDLVQWLGVLPSALPAVGPLSIEGDLRTAGTSLALANAKLRIDEIRGAGNANIDWAGGRPVVKATLELGAVDLNPYLNARSSEPPSDAPPQQDASQASQQQPSQRPARTTPLNVPKSASPQVKGFTGRSGWNEEPMNLLILAALDADLRLSLIGLTYRELKTGAARVALSLKNGQLRTTFEDVKLYGGAGRGVITLESTPAGAAIGANVAVDGVSALPLLKDWSGFDWVEGKGRMQLAVAGQGPHQRAIMEGLNGKADFAFADGAIIGYDVPKLIRGLSQGRIAGLNRQATEKTEFSEAGASFAIKNGVAETKDLRAISTLLRMTGAGTANLGQRQIDMTLRPRLGAAPASQQPSQPAVSSAAAGELTGLELPVRLRGPWERPSVTPDLDGILKNPGQALEALRDIGRQIQQGQGQPGKGGNLNQLIDQFRRR